MKITINDHRKIYAVQKAFSQMFPFLKLDFFAKPNTSGGVSPKNHIVGPSKTIGQCRTVHSKGTLSIMPQMTVSDIEQSFSDTFGLSVQVFHKSDKGWLEITNNMVTLEKQNATAAELSLEETTKQ